MYVIPLLLGGGKVGSRVLKRMGPKVVLRAQALICKIAE